MQQGSEVRQHPGPLNGWRAIAEYLGRNQSTVKRWASEGNLPVHRPKGGAARKGVPVYAFSQELDEWLKGHRTDQAGERGALRRIDLERPSRPQPEPFEGEAARPGHPVRRRALVIGGVAASAILALGVSLWPRDEPVSVVVESDLSPEARQLYLDAHYLWQQRTPTSLQQAEQLLLRVSQLAPRFGGAHADLATVYNLMVEYGVLSPDEGFDRSKAAAGLAIALDPRLARAYAVLGDIAIFWDRDYELGLDYFATARALDPDDAQTRHWYASALMALGHFEQAGDEIYSARALEPLSRSIGVSSAMIQLGLGRPDIARAALLQIIDNEPDYRSPYRFLAFAELATGRYQAYLDAWQRRYLLTADKAGLAMVQAGRAALDDEGSNGLAQAMLKAARTPPFGSEMEPYSLAHVLAFSGNWAEAARHLDTITTRHSFYYGIDPAFAPARQDEAFLTMIGGFGLPVIKSNHGMART